MNRIDYKYWKNNKMNEQIVTGFAVLRVVY